MFVLEMSTSNFLLVTRVLLLLVFFLFCIFFLFLVALVSSAALKSMKYVPLSGLRGLFEELVAFLYSQNIDRLPRYNLIALITNSGELWRLEV